MPISPSRLVRALVGALGIAIVLFVTVREPAAALISVPLLLAGVLSMKWVAFAPVMVVVPIAIGEAGMSSLTGGDGGTSQKLLIAAAILMAAGRFGVKLPHPAVWGIGLFFGVVLGIFLISGDFSLMTPTRAVAATFWYVLPWTLLTVRWPSTRDILLAIAWLPVLILVVGLALELADVRALFRIGSAGTPRLQAGMAAAYVGSSGALGAVAAMFAIRDRRPLPIILALVGLVCLGLSGTRGPLLVLGLVLLAVIVYTRLWRRLSKWMLISVAVVVAVVGAVALAQVLKRSLGEGSVLSGRDAAWKFFWNSTRDTDGFGLGPGAHYDLAASSGNSWISQFFLAPHNTYLQWYVDFGYLGAGVLLLLVAILAVAAIRRSRSRLVASALALGLAGFAFFDNLFASTQPAILTVLLLASAFVSAPRTVVAPVSPSATDTGRIADELRSGR